MPTLRALLDAVERLAPPGRKADFDRIGLQVGDADAETDRVLVALDLTPAVIAEAEAMGAGLVLTHHPLLLHPIHTVTADHPTGALALRLAAAGIGFAAAHTNLDATPGGVSHALAAELGVENVRTLAPDRGTMRKLVVFAPEAHADAVRGAMAAAGAGQIGAYADCSFSAPGTGRFRPLAGTDPHVGAAGGGVHAEPEVRVEVLAEAWQVGAVTRAMRAAHPYEEVAFDVYAVEQDARTVGYGAIGTLPEAEPLDAFLARVADRLGADALRWSGGAEAVRRVAVCGGSGYSFLPAAVAAGADAYVTADITYHRFFEALGPDGAPRLALVDAGHYETERVAERLLADALAEAFPELTVARTRHRTSAMKTFVPG